MNIVPYLKTIYSVDTPIFLKDIRIGGKSKAAIKEAIFRAVKNGEIYRKTNGVYYFKSNKEFGSGINIMDIIERKYLYQKGVPYEFRELFINGYYSGLTFLNKIGLSQQVPATIEITTNETSSKKRIVVVDKYKIIIRKGKTFIDTTNYKVLQFLDMFHFLSEKEVKDNREIIIDYAKKEGITAGLINRYIYFYGPKTLKKLLEGRLINAFAG